MYARIVVPLDGSELAERALPEACRIAEAFAAPVHLVRVVDLTGYDSYGAFGLAAQPSGVAAILQAEREAAETYLSTAADHLIEAGHVVTTEVREGPVRQELQAALCDRDLLVMASHGRGGLARWFLGSVAEDVVRHAAVPVLLVRAISPTAMVANLAAEQGIACEAANESDRLVPAGAAR